MTATAFIFAVMAGVIAAAGGIIGWLNHKANKEARAKIDRKLETVERMRDANVVGDDPAAAKRWLSERGK